MANTVLLNVIVRQVLVSYLIPHIQTNSDSSECFLLGRIAVKPCGNYILSVLAPFVQTVQNRQVLTM